MTAAAELRRDTTVFGGSPSRNSVSANLISNPKAAAELGEKIYLERYRDHYEAEYPGRFVAINFLNQDTYLSPTPEGALDIAYTAAPDGIFHLIQVGHAGAFRVSYTRNSTLDWFL